MTLSSGLFFLGDTWPDPTRVSPLSLQGKGRGEALGMRLNHYLLYRHQFVELNGVR